MQDPSYAGQTRIPDQTNDLERAIIILVRGEEVYNDELKHSASSLFFSFLLQLRRL
jgi:hypothetical protein